jgi:hypothetical protein
MEGAFMDQTLTGIIQGNTIVLDAAPTISSGQAVEVVIRPKQPPPEWGAGIIGSAGGWAAYPELDEIMQRIHEERKRERLAPSLQ